MTSFLRLARASAVALLAVSGCSTKSPDAAPAANEIVSDGPYGRFREVASAEILAVHAALMPDSTVLYFAGSQFEPTRAFGNANYAIWDPATETSTRIDGPDDDLFCAGHAHLADGTLLIAGGNEFYPVPYEEGHLDDPTHFTGHRQTWIYDHRTRTFARGEDMSAGRWYPTVTRGPGGAQGVVIFAGHPEATSLDHENFVIETGTDEGAGPWTESGTFDGLGLGYYPRAHLLSNGEIFIASPTEDLRNISYVPGEDGTLERKDRGDALLFDLSYMEWTTTTVLLPFRRTASGAWPTGRVLRVNGLEPGVKDLDRPGDLPGEEGLPMWRPTGPRPTAPDGSAPKRRQHGSAVMLPTGDVLVLGGVARPIDDGWYGSVDTSVRYTEIYRPSTDEWILGPATSITRNYHSTALLLPDGRVWIAGGNKRSGYSITNQPDGQGRELRVELFEPWYVGHPARPVIEAAQKTSLRTFEVRTPQASSIVGAVVMAPASVTHAFDFDQRSVHVDVGPRDGDRLTITIDRDAPLPDGKYLLFLLAKIEHSHGDEIPSTGVWIDVP